VSGILLSFVGGAAVGGGSGGSTITLYDLALSDTLGAGACGYSMLATGVAQGTEISDFNWCSPGSAAGDYEVYMSIVYNPSGATTSGSAFDTWLAATADRTWVITTPGEIFLALAVRDATSHSVQGTANISLYVP
jgi:hypothetical protein